MAFDLSAWATAKYRYSFVGDEGTSYIAEIHEDGFSGSVTTVDIVGRGSINTRWTTEGNDEFAPMMASETSLSLYDTGEALASDLIDALDTVDNKYMMVIRQGSNLKWVGRIDPESINFDEDGPVMLSVTATDGLGRLENKPYISSTDGSGVDEGSATLVSIIADVLSDTGFGLDFYISSSLVPRAGTAITATQNPLQYVWVNKIAFTSNRDKEERGLVSKLSVLEAICKAWGLRIFQANGAWHLIQVSHLAQNSHRKWQYNSAGTLQGYSDVDPRVSISNENIKRTESTANILPGYKSSIVQYQHGPIRLLRFPQFEPLTISDAEAIFGGQYPWSQYTYSPPNPGEARIYTLDDGTWGMGVREINVVGGLSGKTGYDGIEIDDKGVVFANIPHSTLSPLIGNGFSAQTTDPIPDGVPLKFGASIFGLQVGNNPNPNPHVVADEWVAFQIEHAGTTTRYLKFSADGSLEWSTTNNWCLIRNGLQPNGWASLSLDDIDNTVNDGAMTVRIGPVIYDDTDEALWQKVVWDNVQLFPELPDGQSNYDATSVVSYINNAARSEPRPVQRTVVLGDGPSTYNKGSMYTDSALTTITTDWEITTTGHSGSNTDVSHAEALGELMLRCMHRVRRKHNASYIGYGGILTPLNVLNRSSALWAPWEITATWQGEYSQGSWYRAEYTSTLTNLETEAGIATGAHLLSSFGKGTSSNAGFTYNRIGSSFDTLIARENDRISKVVADPVSGATVTNSGTTVHCEALTDPAGNSLVLEHGDAIYFQSVKTGRILKRIVDAFDNTPAYAPYAAGAITFEVSEAFTTDEYIEQNDPILPGSITGMRIDMDGISVINTHIKSDNWADDPSNGVVDENGVITTSGTDGWIITKAGEAEFNNAIIRGKIDVGGIRIGKDVGYLTGTGDEPTAGEHGIWINSDNYWILDTNADPDKTYFKVGDSNDHFLWDEQNAALKIVSGGDTIFDSSTVLAGIGMEGDITMAVGASIIFAGGGGGSLSPRSLQAGTGELSLGGQSINIGSGLIVASEDSGSITIAGTSTGPVSIGSTSANLSLSTTTSGNISLSPAGTSKVIIDNIPWPDNGVDAPANGEILAWNSTSSTLEWVAAATGSGTVTQINTGGGLTGGPITTTGTISIDFPTAEVSLFNFRALGIDSEQNYKYLDVSSVGADIVGGANAAAVKTTLSLDQVENEALSTWPGSSNHIYLGTVVTGTWNATAIADAYISSASTWNAKIDTAGGGLSKTGTTLSVNFPTTEVSLFNFRAFGIDSEQNYKYLDVSSTGASIIGAASAAAVKTTLSLDQVENQALSTWSGTSNIIYLGTVVTGTWSATNISLAKGGTGASLSDPNADRILFWDDSASTVTWLSAGDGIAFNGTSLQMDWSAAAGSVTPYKVVVKDGDQNVKTITLGSLATASSVNLSSQVSGSLADAYISSAATWNAKIDTAGTGLSKSSTTLSLNSTIPSVGDWNFTAIGLDNAQNYSGVTITSFASTLLDDTSASVARSTLGLGSLATSSTINNTNWSGADLAIANGGTGASTAANARTNLGLGSGLTTTVQEIQINSPGGGDSDQWRERTLTFTNGILTGTGTWSAYQDIVVVF